MAKYCSSCGKEIADDIQFCNHCGAKIAAGSTNNQWGNFNFRPTGATGASEAFSAEDINANKVVAGLAYFLFFLPMIVCPESRYGRFHANQGLVLLIISVVGSIILGIIPVIGWLLLPIFSIAVVVYAIIGLINGLNGQSKELPFIGRWQILK
jgi:uncharacterized membrane protein